MAKTYSLLGEPLRTDTSVSVGMDVQSPFLRPKTPKRSNLNFSAEPVGGMGVLDSLDLSGVNSPLTPDQQVTNPGGMSMQDKARLQLGMLRAGTIGLGKRAVDEGSREFNRWALSMNDDVQGIRENLAGTPMGESFDRVLQRDTGPQMEPSFTSDWWKSKLGDTPTDKYTGGTPTGMSDSELGDILGLPADAVGLLSDAGYDIAGLKEEVGYGDWKTWAGLGTTALALYLTFRRGGGGGANRRKEAGRLAKWLDEWATKGGGKKLPTWLKNRIPKVKGGKPGTGRTGTTPAAVEEAASGAGKWGKRLAYGAAGVNAAWMLTFLSDTLGLTDKLKAGPSEEEYAKLRREAALEDQVKYAKQVAEIYDKRAEAERKRLLPAKKAEAEMMTINEQAGLRAAAVQSEQDLLDQWYQQQTMYNPSIADVWR